MLITELKSKEALAALTEGKKVFLINCVGCKEVHFPEQEAAEWEKELTAAGQVTGSMTTDYICNPDNMKLRLRPHMEEIQAADAVLLDTSELDLEQSLAAMKQIIKERVGEM